MLERDARQAAERAQASLSTTLRSIGDGVIAADERGLVTMMNPVAEALTGWAEAEARGKPLAEVFVLANETTREEVESPVGRVLRHGVKEALASCTVLLGRSGGEIAVADSSAPIRDNGGTVRGVVIVFRDVSRERRAEAQRSFLMDVTRILSSSLDYNETLGKVAEVAVPQIADWCAVHVVGEEGDGWPPKLLAIGHRQEAHVSLARRWAGLSTRDPDASRGVPRVFKTGRSELYPQIDDAFLQEVAKGEEHLQILRELKAHSAIMAPIVYGDRVLGVLSVILGHSTYTYTETDRAMLEEAGRRAGVAMEHTRLYLAEQRAREAADAASRAKDAFLATVSHELRTPMNAILGWAKMLTNGEPDPQRTQHAIETIARNGYAMAQLVEDLLDISRIISGKVRLEVATVDTAKVIEGALESVRPAAEAKNVQIERALDPEAGPVVGDAARLQQVAWNLVSNSVKFTPPGGRVTVSTRHTDAAFELVVHDTGKGISSSFLPHVFDPFCQADNSMARATGGLGLGLAISKHLVELHGGQIEARSDGEGEGATFTVRLPLHVLQPAARATARPIAPPDATVPLEPLSQLQGLAILVVDDDPDARELLKVILEDSGAKVQTAGSVDEAMTEFRQKTPDVLLSDIAMPGATGYDLIQRVRALPPSEGGSVPAAALTAYAGADERRRVLGAGYMMHVTKPVDPAELLAAVASLTTFAVNAQAPP